MIIAGEASGDLHGAKLVEAMLSQDPTLFFCGVGGQALQAAGVRILVEASALAVVGITEVFSKLGSLLKGASRVKKLLKGLKPDLLIIIDFPDFNLHAAAIAKKQGIPVFYYISPQVWAWRKGRVKKIKRLVDHVGVILPFEEAFYKEHHVPVTFVGHPLLDEPCDNKMEAVEANGHTRSFIGLLPGSRDQEVRRNLPAMLEAVTTIHQRFPDIRFCVSKAPTVEKSLMDEILEKFKFGGEVRICEAHVRTIFEKSLLVVAVSGTVTLEAAISGTPTVIVYRVSPLSYWIGRAMIKVKHIGLINLIAGKEIVPELIQKASSPEHIADCVMTLLDEPEKLQNMRADLLSAQKRLGKPGASKRAAAVALELLERGHG
jgi:lipid-A-disaccharide synthase